jgi:hypothetical protein
VCGGRAGGGGRGTREGAGRLLVWSLGRMGGWLVVGSGLVDKLVAWAGKWVGRGVYAYG